MTRTHTIPIGGQEPMHMASHRCWCNPFVSTENTVIHHAADGREKYERQGIATIGQGWCYILEDMPHTSAIFSPVN